MSSSAVANDSNTASPNANGTADAAQVQALQSEITELKRQLDWFKRQLFGSKSEKRVFDDPQQLGLGDILNGKPKDLPPEPKQTITYERGKAGKRRGDDCVTGSGLRFDDSVPTHDHTTSAGAAGSIT